jgi:ABC-type amino acid transport substrate-binding protein
MIEKDRHRAAFEQYLAMGETRSLSKLANRLGFSLNAIKNWSARFHWQERIEERQREVSRVLANKTLRAEVDGRLRSQQLVQVALIQIAKQLAEGRIKATFSDLDKLLRLERFLEGLPESRQEVVATDLRGKTLEELKVALRSEIKELAEIADYEIVTPSASGDGPRPKSEWPNEAGDDNECNIEEPPTLSP